MATNNVNRRLDEIERRMLASQMRQMSADETAEYEARCQRLQELIAVDPELAEAASDFENEMERCPGPAGYPNGAKGQLQRMRGHPAAYKAGTRALELLGDGHEHQPANNEP